MKPVLKPVTVPQPKMECSTCRFFRHNGSYDECRRFPPPYPKAEPANWCGEFKRKDA